MATKKGEIWVIEANIHWRYNKLIEISQKNNVLKKVLKEIRQDKKVKEELKDFKEDVKYDLDIICAELIGEEDVLTRVGVSKKQIFEVLENPNTVDRLLKKFLDTDITVDIFRYCIRSYMLGETKSFLQVIEEEAGSDLIRDVQEGVKIDERNIDELYSLFEIFIIVQLSKDIENAINIKIKLVLQDEWLRIMSKNKDVPAEIRDVFKNYSQREQDDIIQNALVVSLSYLPEHPEKTFKENFLEALKQCIIHRQN